MKRLYLHIGFNKTGSTSLQNTLSSNAAALEKTGVLYPGAATDSYVQNHQHTPLAAVLPERAVTWLRPQKRRSQGRALPDLLRDIEASPANTVILSSEAFGGLDMTHDRIQMVRDKLSMFDVSVIAYIRRQDTYLLSLYQEAVKNGATHPFNFAKFPSNQQLFFSQRLAPWRTVFGSDRVIIRPFDKKFWPQGELLLDFLSAINLPSDGIPPMGKPKNESLDYRSVELIRRLNLTTRTALNNMPPQKQKTARTTLLRIIRTFEAKQGNRAKMQLSSTQSNELRSYFAEDNAISLAGTGVTTDAFFPEMATDMPPRIAPDRLDETLLINVITSLATIDKTGARSS